MTDSTTIAAAQSAWARIERAATFDDWVAVAQALAIGRRHAMAVAKTNKPFGRRFVAAIGAWLRQHKLDRIPGQERHSAVRMLDQLDTIERWRAGLDPAVRRRLNHPNSIWWRWKRSTAGTPVITTTDQFLLLPRTFPRKNQNLVSKISTETLCVNPCGHPDILG